ncbi:MAG: sulfate ABC transporter permease subunit CysT [Deltaproteobacteria bacterium]|nr:sulfate ABC transporter permease subunit CysT [Deltaproteobacteria bacterium]
MQQMRLPGKGLSLGYSMLWLSVIVVMPLTALGWKSASLSFADLFNTLGDVRVRAALSLSLSTAAFAAAINVVFGLIVAWVLVRYDFFGRKIFDAVIDLPFALPTAVAGIALTAVYGQNGIFGAELAKLGIKVAYTPLGVLVALIFVGLPFVVRTVQPIIQDLNSDVEEAAAILGANRFCIFRRIILPELTPALATGFTLAFARGLGEYGSVVFISGNLPLRTEVIPLLIVTKLEQYDYAGAMILAIAMLFISLLILLLLNALSRWQNRSMMTPNSQNTINGDSV